VCGGQGTFLEKICPFSTLERQSIQTEAMTRSMPQSPSRIRAWECKPAVENDARTPDKPGSLHFVERETLAESKVA
jgi:hypothetical protein